MLSSYIKFMVYTSYYVARYDERDTMHIPQQCGGGEYVNHPIIRQLHFLVFFLGILSVEMYTFIGPSTIDG